MTPNCCCTFCCLHCYDLLMYSCSDGFLRCLRHYSIFLSNYYYLACYEMNLLRGLPFLIYYYGLQVLNYCLNSVSTGKLKLNICQNQYYYLACYEMNLLRGLPFLIYYYGLQVLNYCLNSVSTGKLKLNICQNHYYFHNDHCENSMLACNCSNRGNDCDHTLHNNYYATSFQNLN